MGHRLLCPNGFFLGDMYFIMKYQVESTNTFENRRELFGKLGIPMERMMSAMPVLIGYNDTSAAVTLPRDYDLGENLPDVLSQ